MKLFFRHIGKGEPLLILHGMFGASDNWMSIARALSTDFSVYALDLRNHGQSPHHPQMTYDLMAMDIREFLEDHGLDRVHLMGHSMGGKVAMRVALDYPHRVSRLIVVDIAPKPYPPWHRELLMGLQQINLKKLRDRKDAQVVLSRLVEEERTRQFLLKNLARDDQNRFRWKFNLDALIENLDHLLDWPMVESAFDRPTLFIRGEDSNYILSEDLPQIRRWFPQAHLITVHQASHWVHADQPDELIKVVRHFLKSEFS